MGKGVGDVLRLTLLDCCCAWLKGWRGALSELRIRNEGKKAGMKREEEVQIAEV
jgi:hypothetical protein